MIRIGLPEIIIIIIGIIVIFRIDLITDFPKNLAKAIKNFRKGVREEDKDPAEVKPEDTALKKNTELEDKDNPPT